MSDSDNKAISVEVQLDLDLPTGTELGNILGVCPTYQGAFKYNRSTDN